MRGPGGVVRSATHEELFKYPAVHHLYHSGGTVVHHYVGRHTREHHHQRVDEGDVKLEVHHVYHDTIQYVQHYQSKNTVHHYHRSHRILE